MEKEIKMKKIIIDEECCGKHKHEKKEHEHNEKEFKGHDDFTKHFKREFKEAFRGEFKDSFRGEHKKHKKHRPFVHIMNDKKVQQTKLFDNKKDMVEFVNQIGEDGTEVDIFKIEDGLYKVVVFKKTEE